MVVAPKSRNDNTYTFLLPYFRATGTQKRLEMPCSRAVAENKYAALEMLLENLAMEAGANDPGMRGEGGYAWKMSMVSSTIAIAGPAAMKLDKMRAALVKHIK
jgi:hypothetical protein